MRIFYIGFCVILLLYMLWPGPNKISDFTPLPDSIKSKLDGDVWQIPNVVGYFSDNYREFTVPFYISDYSKKVGLPFLPLRINHPPEFSWNAIKKHTDSTYLEELVYPLRDSLYINGMEPFYNDGVSKFWGSSKFSVEDQSLYTKATLRFFPSSPFVKFLVWLGISVSTLLLYKLGRRIIFNV